MNEMGALTAQHTLRTAVLLLIFSRPDTTQLIFNEIRKVKPNQLFVAADSPRKDRPGDAIICYKKWAIVDQVAWDCKVTKLFRNENVGSKVAIRSVIDRFLSNVEEGITLKDDCVPGLSFSANKRISLRGFITRIINNPGEKHITRQSLIAGGSGCIGSHFCEKYLNAGHEVLCIDNFFIGRRQNIVHLRDNKNFEIICHDVIFPLFSGTDEICNPASPVYYQLKPGQTIKTCVVWVIIMLGLAKRLCTTILQAAISDVYATRPSVIHLKVMGATSIPLVPAAAMMKANAARIHCSFISTSSMG